MRILTTPLRFSDNQNFGVDYPFKEGYTLFHRGTSPMRAAPYIKQEIR